MQIVNATTAANYFHLLRRQVHSLRQTPLIVFTPKQGLRMKQTRSQVDELTHGSFQEVLDDPGDIDADAVTRIVFCSGKVAWDAIAGRDERQAPVAIVRVEQLYPLPTEQMLAILEKYPNARELRWLQEEPENMGPWAFIERHTWRIKEQGYDLQHVDPCRVRQPRHRLQGHPRPGTPRPHGPGTGLTPAGSANGPAIGPLAHRGAAHSTVRTADSGLAHRVARLSEWSPSTDSRSVMAWSALSTLMVVMPMAAAGLRLMPRSSRNTHSAGSTASSSQAIS